MKTVERGELLRRARRCGIQPVFTDSSGCRQKVGRETLRALVELLDDPAREPWPVPPVIVCWQGRAKNVPLGIIPSTLRRTIRPGVSLPLIPHPEGRNFPRGGGALFPPEEAVHRIRHILVERHAESVVLRIPPLPFGYYDLLFEANRLRQRTLVISAPVKAYGGDGSRMWGVFAPMYALSSGQSWGAGTLSDWRELCEWLAELNGVFPKGSAPGNESSGNVVAATLPLLGAFLDEWKCEPSPYSPATRLFWNEFFLDVTCVPEFAASKAAQRLVQSASFQREMDVLRRGVLVDYGAEMNLKRRVLEVLAEEFFRNGPRRELFEEFLRQRPGLDRYAGFRAVCQTRSQAWHLWPKRLRDGKLRPGDYDEQGKRYHLFVQWLAQEQMEAVLARCRELGVSFYLDLPLGTHPEGYDVWANQHLFMNGVSVGAPPDAFFTKGQNWGFPPLHPQRMREDGYGYVLDYLRFQMRHTGLLRLDHVMGLHRLWWVLPGASAADGAYVTYRADELYAILSLESHIHQTMLIGENLGTVPPEVNRSMDRHGIRSMYVAQYEAQPRPRRPLRNPPPNCAASLNTHDMPTWAAFWKGMDIADRQELGLLTPAQARKERKGRARLRSALAAFLDCKRLLKSEVGARATLAALIAFLGRSDADLVLVNLEDLWLETDPQNTPGTSTERVNWRRKVRNSLERIRKDPIVRRLLQKLKESRTQAL